MQTRCLLLVLVATAVALSGCAENSLDPGEGDGATPPAAVSHEEAAALFAAAAGSLPERYGMEMVAANQTSTLMSANAVFDNASQTVFMRMRMDPALLAEMGSGAAVEVEPGAFQDFAIYVSPQGNAFRFNDTVMLTEAEQGQFEQAAQGQDGFEALANPEAFIGELEENDFTVKSVTPTVLRGKGALQVDATVTEEGVTSDVSVWIFQDPTRIGRVVAAMPAEEEGEETPFGNATMTLDILYEGEVSLEVPAELQRALGLRYESDRSPFSFGGDEGAETWTFQAAGGIPLGEVQAEVGDFDPQSTSVSWTMLLTESPKTQDGVTLTFTDADGDGTVSAGDTLVIERGEDDSGLSVSLKDTTTGLRVVPGAGALLGGLALLGVALLARRR